MSAAKQEPKEASKKIIELVRKMCNDIVDATEKRRLPEEEALFRLRLIEELILK